MKGEDVTLEHFQRQGFNSPIFVPDKAGLHIKVQFPFMILDSLLTKPINDRNSVDS